MPFEDWTTDLPTNLDSISTNQPDLLDDPSATPNPDPPLQGHQPRVSHPHTLRDIAQYNAYQIGSDAKDAGTIRDILDKASTEALWLRLAERASDPTPVADRSFLYAKDDGGVTKLYMIWSDGTVTLLGAPTVEFTDNTYYPEYYESGLTLDTTSLLTIGLKLLFTRTGVMTGIRFRTIDTASTTFRGKLWNNTTEVASGTVATSAAGVYDITFTSPYTITDSMLGDTFYLSLYDTVNEYVTYSSTDPPGTIQSIGMGWAAIDGIPRSYRNGDDSAAPTSDAGVGRYPVAPLYTITLS